MSMGVIARAIGDHWVSEPDGGTATESWCDCTCGARITVPGGTRDEAWRRGDEHQADAVREALLTDETVKRAARAFESKWDELIGNGDVDHLTPEAIIEKAMRAALTAAIEGEQ